MKIEMCADTADTLRYMTMLLSGTLVICTLTYFVYRYNAKAFELGYTQKQLQNSQLTVWVKD